MKRYVILIFTITMYFQLSAQKFIAPAGKKIVKSEDGGKSWSIVWENDMDSKVPGAFVTSIAQGNGKILVAGSTLVVSEDGGSSWKEVSLVGHTGSNNILEKYLTQVSFGNGVFLLSIPFRTLYSTDGYNWQYIQKGQPATFASSQTKTEPEKKGGLSKGLNKLKAMSGNGESGTATSKSQANPPGLDEGVDFIKSPLSISFINDKFFIAGGNRSMELATVKVETNELKVDNIFDLYSTYGNAATLGTGGLGNIATNGKAMVIVSQGSSKSGFSLDGGDTWKFFKNPEEKQTSSVTFGKNQFLAVNHFSEVFTSADPVKGWTVNGKFYDLAKPANKVIFTNNKFFVFCHNLEVFQSDDGKKWEMLTNGPNVGLNLYDVVVLK